jgi:hypothetical protein
MFINIEVAVVFQFFLDGVKGVVFNYQTQFIGLVTTQKIAFQGSKILVFLPLRPRLESAEQDAS